MNLLLINPIFLAFQNRSDFYKSNLIFLPFTKKRKKKKKRYDFYKSNHIFKKKKKFKRDLIFTNQISFFYPTKIDLIFINPIPFFLPFTKTYLLFTNQISFFFFKTNLIFLLKDELFIRQICLN